MTQPSLTGLEAPRAKKAVNVPRTSVAAYRERPRDGRIADAVWAVDAWPEKTSAELAWLFSVHPRGRDFGSSLANRLYLRRGLSDGLLTGLVEHADARKCAVSGRLCVTWKLRSR